MKFNNFLRNNILLQIIIILIGILLIRIASFQLLNTVTTIILAYSAYKSKNNLFWIIFAFIYSNSPAGLFDTYSFGIRVSGIVIDVMHIICIVLILKVINNKHYHIFFNKYLILIAVIIVINGILGVLSELSNINIFFRIFKVILPFGFIFVSLRVIREEIDFYLFFNSVFPFVFLSFFSQIYIYFTGFPLVDLFFPNDNVESELININRDLSRYIYSIYLQTVSLLGATYYLSFKQDKFKKLYLLLIVFIVLFSVLLSGTRAWTIGILFIVVFSFIYSRNFKNIFGYLFVAVLVFFILLNTVPMLRVQLDLATERILTAELVVKGDITAGGTLQRFDVRAPKLINYFKQTNILFGAGYKEYMFKYQDGHVGHHNVLFQGGLIGFIFMYLLIVYLIFSSIRLNNYRNQWKNGYIIFIILLIGLTFIQTSVQIFSYVLMPLHGTFYGFLLSFANYSYINALGNKFIKN